MFSYKVSGTTHYSIWGQDVNQWNTTIDLSDKNITMANVQQMIVNFRVGQVKYKYMIEN